MKDLAQLCEAIAATTRKTEKVALVAHYLRSHPPAEAAAAAVFLSGRAFPAREERTLNVGGAQLWRAVVEVSGKSDADLTAAYRKHGDLGAAAHDVLEGIRRKGPKVSIPEFAQVLDRMAAARGVSPRAELLRELLQRLSPLEAKYAIKIIAGELRIGLRESLVEEAVAQAFDAPLREVQRANMLLGDIGETLLLASRNRLRDARMRLFHPIGFMLASPVESAQEAIACFTEAAVEDKYDGIRAQAHVSGGQVRLFSRTLDDITGSFPELEEALAAFEEDLILDGEIVAWTADAAGAGRALPFSRLQQRLGRKRVTAQMMRDVPAAYIAFDVLYAAAELVIEKPLRERGRILDAAFSRVAARPAGARVRTRDAQGALQFEPAVAADDGLQAPVLRAPLLRAGSAEQLEQWFEMALERGNEGLMIKDLESPYTPGRRGRAWLKLKRELATLDVVVTAVEWGHGKRAGVLSDYTFAVRDGDRLLNVGKAYSGLTDQEIAEMTRWFFDHTIRDHGFWREVEPKVVLEVAFNAVMRSDRHESGYALRFPRILRIRTDKPAAEIDTLDRVREIYERQKWPG